MNSQTNKTSGTQTFYTGGLTHMLRSVRKEKALSIRSLAKLSGLSYATVLRFEHGKYGSVANLAKISEALGVGVPEVKFEPKEKE